MGKALSYLQIIFFISLFVFSCNKPQSVLGAYTGDSSYSNGSEEKKIFISNVRNKTVYDKYHNTTYRFLDNGDLFIKCLSFTNTYKLWGLNKNTANQAYYYIENNVRECVKYLYSIENAPNEVVSFFRGYVVEDGKLFEVAKSEEYKNYMYAWFNTNGHYNSGKEWIPNNNAYWSTNPYFYRPISMIDFSNQKILIGELK